MRKDTFPLGPGGHATTVVLVLALLALCGVFIPPARAQYFPVVPPSSIMTRQTPVTVSYAQPQKNLVIDISKFDPNQVLISMAVNLTEPVSSASFTVYGLSQKPPEVPDPKESSIEYFTVRVDEALLEKAVNVIMRFTVSKVSIQENNVGIETISLNRFYEGQWQQLPTRLVQEGNTTILFEAESQGLSHFAVTGIVQAAPFPRVPSSMVIAGVVVVFICVFIYGIRRQWWL